MNAQKASNNSKAAWAAIWCACLAFLFSAPALAEKQTMIYEVYAGGIHAVRAQMVIEVNKDRYSVNMDAHTRGFLGKLAPWEGTFESHGWVLGEDKYQPELHRSTAIWKGESEVKSYNYAKDGSFKSLVIKDHDKPEERPEIADELTQGTIDVLTATLYALSEVAQGKPCAGTSEVFDGKRRFRQEFQSTGTERLELTRYNIYAGDTQVCTVEVAPVAGDWHDKPRGWMSIQEQGRERGTMPTVWMGKLKPGAMAVPIKIRVKTQFGTLFMHLAEYRSGNEVLVAETRPSE